MTPLFFQDIDEMIEQATRQGYSTFVDLGNKGFRVILNSVIMVSVTDITVRYFDKYNKLILACVHKTSNTRDIYQCYLLQHQCSFILEMFSLGSQFYL